MVQQHLDQAVDSSECRDLKWLQRLRARDSGVFYPKWGICVIPCKAHEARRSGKNIS